MHEMNGNWYPWAGGVNGNSPALHVQAWRRLVTISRQHGARNVRVVNENKERDWRADATPQIAAAFRPASKLRLHTARRMRAGANTTMRWSGVGKMRVTHWRVGVEGRAEHTSAAARGG